MNDPVSQRVRAVLAFWFGDLDQGGEIASSSKLGLWWGKDPDVDRQVVEALLEDHLAAARGEREHWLETPAGCAALVVLLDQVPRNAFRDTAHAFATDAHARRVTCHAVEQGLDRQMPRIWRYFTYMPLMHSEHLVDHEQAQALFDALAAEAAREDPGNAAYFASAPDYERRHAAIVARFGRYPHRNRALGRDSTPAEQAFLLEDGSSF